MSDEFDELPVTERVAAFLSRATELMAQAKHVSPEAASQLRALAFQWITLAERLEMKADEPDVPMAWTRSGRSARIKTASL